MTFHEAISTASEDEAPRRRRPKLTLTDMAAREAVVEEQPEPVEEPVSEAPSPSERIESYLAEAREAGGLKAFDIELDSAFARELLGRNFKNRKVSKTRVARFQHDVAQAKWKRNGQPIVIGSDGSLMDGQHRSHTVVDTDLKMPVTLMVGVEPEARATMDQGKARTAGDILKMEGEELGEIAAAISRYALAYDARSHESIFGTSNFTTADIQGYFEQHADDVRRSAEIAFSLRESARYHVAAPLLGFLHYVAYQVDADAADQYVRQIAKGSGLEETNPAYVVRERLIRLGRAGGAKKLETLLLGWNAMRSGRELKKVRLTGALPSLT